jgi:hypothetical protein
VKFSDRDLLVIVLIFGFAAVLGTIDVLAEIKPVEADSILDSALIAAVVWFFYRIGKNGS